MAKVIRSIADAKGIKLGEQYIVDVYPSAKDENQEITPEMEELVRNIHEAVAKEVEKEKEDV